jgi:SAM-dependent methyltransferase
MGLSDLIFGRFLDWCMSSKVIARERPAALQAAHGEVLELGFGTGLNLPYFPDAVKRLTVVDPEDLMPKRVAERIAAARFPVERARLGAERLSFDANRFDCAVSTFTMCTIGDASAAMREVRRVLKPGGSFLFLEHGLSDEPSIKKMATAARSDSASDRPRMPSYAAHRSAGRGRWVGDRSSRPLRDGGDAADSRHHVSRRRNRHKVAAPIAPFKHGALSNNF